MRILIMLLMLLMLVPSNTVAAEEMRGVWFSFMDWQKLPVDEENFRIEVDKVMENIHDADLNTIFVHVHSHSDSYYLKNQHFPMTKFFGGVMGQNPNYDPLEIMIDAAHNYGIKIHAWINPYRVTIGNNGTYSVTWDEIPENSVVKQWLIDYPEEHTLILHDNKCYLNPANDLVKNYLNETVRDLIMDYAVDGIHLDDYFYPEIPEIDDDDPDFWFDKIDYEESGSMMSIADWRRENVSSLVRQLYSTVKQINPNLQFGVSPAGILDNLRKDTMYFVDIDTWLATPGYVDYILPQIYFGLDMKNSDGSAHKVAFKNCLNDWLAIPRDENVKMYIGLALYKAGGRIKTLDQNEWRTHDDVIARQISEIQKHPDVDGWAFFDYKSLVGANAAKEVANYKKILQ